MSDPIRFDGHKLDGKKLMVGTPMYGGNGKTAFTRCAMDLAVLCDRLELPMLLATVTGESLIPRARNVVAQEFMKSDATHLLFIDADLHFDPVDAIRCLEADKDMIGGPYPMKDIDWGFIKKLVQARPDITEDELQTATKFYHFNYLPGQRLPYDYSQPLEVMNVSTGFMMATRGVFDAIRAARPDESYRGNMAREVDRNVVERYYNYFGLSIEDDVLLSEDYYFCKRWQETGGKIWLAPWMKMRHIGDYTYGGDGLEASEQNRWLSGDYFR